MKLIFQASLALALAVPFAIAQTPIAKQADTKTATATLNVGDMAPAISIEKWVKGTPVTSFEKGKVYIVEFWATWCGPCIRGMPHLTELQKKYKAQGLTIIGTTRPDRNGNTLEKVEAMVADKGDEGMGYTVAWDGESKTSDAYMRAAEQGGIPCAFLVDKEGRVAYIGHPMSIDATLEQVLAGKHDIKALAAKYAHDKELEAKADAIQARLGAARGAKDYDAVIQACDDLIAMDAEKFGGAAMVKFMTLMKDKEDPTAALAYASQVLTGIGKDNANMLNSIAWTMVDPESPLAKTDLALAMKLAQRAVDISKRADAGSLDTLARVYFTKGDVDKAIELQTEAVKIEPRLQDSLDEYKKAKDSKKVGG